MRRLTTPTHKFTFSSAIATNYKVIHITYAQHGVRLCISYNTSTKAITVNMGTSSTYVASMVADNKILTLKLSQAATALFKAGLPLQIQIRALKTDGTAISSEIIDLDVVEESLCSDILSA